MPEPPRQEQVGHAFRHLWTGEDCLDQGDRAGALGHFRNSLSSFHALAAADPASIPWQTQLAHCHLRIGTALLRQGRTETAHASWAQSREICLKVLASGTGPRWWVATHLGRLCDAMLTDGGDADDALESSLMALEIWRSLAAQAPAEGNEVEVATSLIRVGTIRQMQGSLKTALEHFLEALEIRKHRAQEHPDESECQAAVALAHARVGMVLAELGELRAALSAHKSAAAGFRKLVAAEPDNTDWRNALGFARDSIDEIAQAALARRASS